MNGSPVSRHGSRHLSVFLAVGFRPFFLAAGAGRSSRSRCGSRCSSAMMQLPTRFDPLAWHIHEMLFGFVMAAVAGFLLTAIPNWTGRLPVRGYRSPYSLASGCSGALPA